MSNYVDLPINFKRLSPDPLESNVTFNTVSDLLNYTYFNDSCYPGQVCSCVETNSLYVISSDLKLMSVKSSQSSSPSLEAFWTGTLLVPTFTLTPFKDSLTYAVDDRISGSVAVAPLSNIETFISSTPNVGGSINAANCINLRTLTCTNTKITSLNITNCVKLTALNCSGNQLPSIQALNLPILKTIDCSSNSNLSDVTLANLPILTDANLSYISNTNNSQSSLTLSNCPKLASINLTSSYFGKIELINLPFLTNYSITNIASLVTLNLSSIPFIPTSVATLQGFNAISNISLVNTPLSQLSATNKQTLATVNLQSNVNLLSVSLKQCSNLNTIVIKNNSNLNSLSINESSSLSYVDLQNNNLSTLSISNCPNLLFLTIKNEPNLSTNTVDAILEGLVNAGNVNGALILYPGVSSPSCQGEVYASTLRDRGWTTVYEAVQETTLFENNIWLDSTQWVDCKRFN